MSFSTFTLPNFCFQTLIITRWLQILMLKWSGQLFMVLWCCPLFSNSLVYVSLYRLESPQNILVTIILQVSWSIENHCFVSTSLVSFQVNKDFLFIVTVPLILSPFHNLCCVANTSESKNNIIIWLSLQK